jgi:hypothetical protein
LDVSLDVPQLPVLDVQNAAIILEDVPDVQTIFEVQFSESLGFYV